MRRKTTKAKKKAIQKKASLIVAQVAQRRMADDRRAFTAKLLERTAKVNPRLPVGAPKSTARTFKTAADWVRLEAEADAAWLRTAGEPIQREPDPVRRELVRVTARLQAAEAMAKAEVERRTALEAKLREFGRFLAPFLVRDLDDDENW